MLACIHFSSIPHQLRLSRAISFLVVISKINYQAFHLIVELVGAVIGFCIVIIALNTYKISKNSFFTFIAITYGFVEFIGLLHAFSFKGINIFPDYDSNLPTQLWLIARYIEVISLFISFNFLKGKTLKIGQTITAYFLITSTLLFLAFNRLVLPTCYIEGSGLTSFKIVSEFIIAAISAINIFLLYCNKKLFNQKVYKFLKLSFLFGIVAEISFCFYIDVFGYLNMIGHIFKIIAAWFLYKATVETTIRTPFETLFSEMKNSNEMLLDVLSFGKIGYWEFNTNTGKLNLSEEMYKILGVTEKISNVNELTQVFTENEYSNAVNNIISSLEANGISEQESNYTRKDGSNFWLYSKTKAKSYENNKIHEILGIAQDITRSKIIEEELLQAKQKAESSSKAKSYFLANMSHEIRTPLNGVIGFIDLLSETKLNNDQMNFVNEAKKSSQLLLNLINDILDFSKIEAGKMSVDNFNFDLRTCIEDISILFAPVAQRKNLELNTVVYPNVAEIVTGDPCKLKQILNNLIDNAIKFTHEGEILISARQIEETENTTTIHFEVSDTGIGISEENQQKIFDMFEQADPSSTRKYGGTGLGLSITKKIVEIMGGNINIKSEPNKGSTFSFTLRFKKNNAVSGITNNSTLKDKKIFLVDSNLTNLQVLRHYLESEFCIVEQVTSAKDAISALLEKASANELPDLIILDHTIQDITGFELAKIIKSNDLIKNIPLILLTTFTQNGSSNLIKEEFCTITKPVRRNDLLNCISVVINPIISIEKTKILVVEDNEVNQILISEILKNAEFSFDIAPDGASAIAAYKSENYDLVLMDCQMPDIDGYTVTKEIRKLDINKHTPIIAMTAYATEEDREKCLDAGMDDYISKPINIDTTLNVINKYINKPSRNLIPTNSDIKFVDIVNNISAHTGLPEEKSARILNKFIELLPNTIISMNEALKKEDFVDLRNLAHSLKGSSGNLVLTDLYNAALELEELSKSNEKTACINILAGINEIAKNLKHLS